MIADCFHYQVDIMGGDGSSSTYRFGGSKQQSSSNEQSLFCENFRSFHDAFVSRQEAHAELPCRGTSLHAPHLHVEAPRQNKPRKLQTVRDFPYTSKWCGRQQGDGYRHKAMGWL